MWSASVVVALPALDDNLGLPQRVKDITVEQFVAKAAVEAFDESIFSRAAWCDVGRLRTDSSEPILHGLGWPRTQARYRAGCGQARHAGI
jgi:hypothetical protein